MNPALETFTLQLDRQTRCTARIDVQRIKSLPPESMIAALMGFSWEGKPTAAHYPAWLKWFASVCQHTCDAANKSVVVMVFTPEGKPLAIICEPNAPTKIEPLPMP